MKITKIKIECSSCDKYFILAHNGEDKPTCCPFCGSELEENKELEDDYSDSDSLAYDEETTFPDTLNSDEDY